jgi:transcriptional regulator with XRE-family HTH domain
VQAEGDLSGGERAAWRQWMRELGQQLRRLRELLGLSQDQLARLAGVSQGAVSRLETGRGVATPLLTVLKINLALARELQQRNQTIPDTDPRRPLDIGNAHLLADTFVPTDAVQRVPDADFEAFVRLYRDTPERLRAGLLAIMTAAAAGLK